MRNEHYKQVACVSELDAESFEQKINTILAGIINPEIILDKAKPFTAYIIYRVRKEVPETVLELLEMLDADGGHATCKDCPHLVRSKDKRKKWHKCGLTGEQVKEDSRACETYYIEKRKQYREIIEEYMQIPYTIE